MGKKIYRAPKDSEEFKKYWRIFLPHVVERDNFHTGHLQQLEILCDLYVDYNTLTQFVKENGYSFMTGGRYGDTSRPHTEVQVRQRVVAEIRAYSKMLGILLNKGIPTSDDPDEWD